MRKKLIVGCIGAALLWQAAPITNAAGQTTQPTSTPTLQPLSLPHLYWHFLIYVNVLDQKAAELTAEGKNGAWLRNDLQKRLQFSDADFAPIRISSERLSSELAALNQQAKTILAAGPSASTDTQMQALVVQRETDINNEITYLSQALSLEKRAALEAFMKQFFAPKPLTYDSSGSGSQSAGTGDAQ